MSSFYKMDPAAWDFGTAELTLEQEAAYLRIVNAIHKHDGPVPYIDRVIAGLFRCSTRKARSLVEALVDAGKITIEDDHIWNERARSDMVQRQLTSGSAAVRGSKGGRTRAKNVSKSLKNNKPPQANASSRIEENRREENKPPNPLKGGSDDLFSDSLPEKPSKPETPIDILSEIIPRETAKDFIEHRKALRKPLTVAAAKRAASQLAKFKNPVASVDASIMNGWAGVFEQDQPQGGRRSPETSDGSGLLNRVAAKHGDWR
jgi:uncharacterized protein YdaU (DUF1376 family)